ncbi:hypothetical protein KSS87_012841, partial [Heliosperma pusillum]
RGLLKIMEEEFSGPPINVLLELVLGFVLCVYAGLTVPGKFQSIHPDSDENRGVELGLWALTIGIWGGEDLIGRGMGGQGGEILSNKARGGLEGRRIGQRIVSLPENLDFMIFNHRGRVVLSESDLKLKL